MEFLKPHMKPYQPRRSTRRRSFSKLRSPLRSNSSDFEDFTLETEMIEDSSNASAHFSNDTTKEQDFSNKNSDMPDVSCFELVTVDDTINSKNHDANLTNPTKSNCESCWSKAIFIEDVAINEEESRSMPELSAEESGDEVSSFFQYAVIAIKALPPECQQNVITKIFDAIVEARSWSHIIEEISPKG